jgi:hypothetical protein
MASDKDNDIASIRARLEELDAERNALAEQWNVSGRDRRPSSLAAWSAHR